MAYTTTIKKQSVFGNERVTIFDVTADANSGVVDSGFSYVDGFAIGIQSVATAGPIHVKANLNGASAASNGKLLVSGIASGDQFFLTVYGH